MRHGLVKRAVLWSTAGVAAIVLGAALIVPSQAQDILVLPKSAKATSASSTTIPNIFVPTAKSVTPSPTPVPAEQHAALRIVPGLEEPLVATGSTTAAEDTALTAALTAFQHPAKAPNDYTDSAKPLLDFMAQYPASNWTMALQTNLGLGYYRAGYFTRAFAAWEQAWQLGRSSTVIEVKRLTDRAVGELARMHARVGHADKLEAIFADLGDRKVSGAATELMTGAHEGRWVMRNDFGNAYLCGPKALVNVLRTLKATPEQIKVADDARSGANGFSLTQVSALADQAGLAHKLVYRKAGQPIPVPSIVNWKVNHYAAIVAMVDGKYQIKDPTFASGDLLVSTAALDAESSGYYLVPATVATSSDWRTVAPQSDEAKAVFGMGWVGQSSFETAWYQPLVNGTCPPPVASSPVSNDSNFKVSATSNAGSNVGMCGVNAHTMTLSLHLTDTPVVVAVPKGPSTKVTLTYNQREATQPANFSSSNLGQKWSHNWMAYVVDNPGSVVQVDLYSAGGGFVTYYNYTWSGSPSDPGLFAPERQTGAVLARWPATGLLTGNGSDGYELRFTDGSRQFFGKLDGSPAYPRRVFLTKVIDPAGNAVTLNYDAQLRVTSLTDATGKVTSFSYTNSDPLLITGVTDPFGRSATLNYTGGALSSITDAIGITSSFGHDAAGLVNSMTTPYGTSSFAYGEGVNDQYERWLQMTDPLGQMERLESLHLAPGILNTADPAKVPTGMNVYPGFDAYRNTFYWDKQVVATLGTADYTKARRTHWVHDGYFPWTVSLPESTTNPLENTVYFNYPNQANAAVAGTTRNPSVAGRVLDGGVTQLQQATYNSLGKPLTVTDPKGRVTSYTYAANDVDLVTVKQKTDAAGTLTTVGSATYNSAHEPLTVTDAAGQVWNYAYNAAGQIIYATNPLNQTRFWEYDASGRLTKVTIPKAVTSHAAVVYGTTNVGLAAAQTLNYTNACAGMTLPANTNLPISVTDSEGYTVCKQYDALDRVTKVKYPDNTTDLYDYTFPVTFPVVASRGTPSLDLWQVTDRLGRVTTYNYDQNRRKISETETVTVNGATTTRTTQYQYYANGALKNLIDANGNTTHWEIDIQSRPTSKTYAYGTADAKTESYTYDRAGRLKAITDAKGQVLTKTYNVDDTLANYAYTNAVVPTAGANFSYDSFFPRPTAMLDAFGTTSWSYKPLGAAGALQPNTENGPFAANDTLGTGYDAAGRVNSRTVDTAVETFSYDVLGRLASHVVPDNAQFNYSYLGQTGQLTQRLSVWNGIRTNWSYNPNPTQGGRVLLGITNTNNGRAYAYGYTIPAEYWAAVPNHASVYDPYQLTGITETMPPTHPFISQLRSYAYDQADRLLTANASVSGNQSFSYDKLDNATSFSGSTAVYNGLNQLGSWNGQALTYDANGNLTADSTRSYTYDAADRLIRINYVGSTAKTEFGYDGLGRRTTMTETPATGAATTTRFLWCGGSLCQERTATDVVTRRYYPEGERRPQTSESFTYLQDHQGSVREMIGAGSGIMKMAYDYDAYGKPTNSFSNTSSPHTNKRYAGLFYHPTSGLYLSTTRAYDPNTGRWLNRDPIRESGGINMYGYVGGRPTMAVDPFGLYTITDAIGDLIGGGVIPAGLGYSDTQIFDAWLRLERGNMHWIDELPLCPPTLAQCVGDNWEKPGNANELHPGGDKEVRSKETQGGHSNQCVYDKGGQLMTKPPAAGSADFKACTGICLEHLLHDVDTFFLAKRLGRIEDYYSVRPVK